MPTLTWVGKDKVVNHHLDVPFRVLQRENHFDAPQGTPANSTDNRIIHGDNLAALKSLLPEFEGKINCIYIDPPYNTGNESWVYNDAVNDPKIKKWLGQVVGKEGEDLSRHDKWLCMMYPRLKLLHWLLAMDGCVFISIGDAEQANLRLLCDEIFGQNKRLTTFIWRTDGNFDNQAKIKNCHEYILMYAKSPENFLHPNVVDPSIGENSKLNNPFIRNTIVKNGHKNPISEVELLAGFPADFENGTIPARTNQYPHYDYNLVIKDGKLVNNVVAKTGWSSKSLLMDFIEKEFEPVLDTKGQKTRFVITSTGAIESIKERNNPSHVISVISGVGSTQSQSAELANMGFKFSFPKPTELINYLISMHSNKSSIILDSFAGSGTTAHAVLKLNAQDQGNRRFILIEMEDYADTITAERVRRVMSGYGEGNKQTAGLGGSFDYYTVGAAIFNPYDTLNEAVGVDVIHDYVSYSEDIATKYRTAQNNAYTPYLLGLSPETAWIFYYEPNTITCLDLDFLGTLKFGANKPATAIIYADKCLFNKEFLTKHGIIFKKIPRDITRF
jgi:adenine-specific DNA-methyltransferase